MAAPPFTLTPRLLDLVAAIERLVGRFEGIAATRPQPELRKQNRIRTVLGSVAIEGNALSLEQVTAVLEGKRVLGPAKDVLEVENAIAAYAEAPRWRLGSERDILKAHRVLMSGLVSDAGRWRTGNVGVLRGSRVAHVAPQAKRVPGLMTDLLRWLTRSEISAVIRAAVAHYEIEFIHPFTDGNGRMGRLWQHVGLLRVSEVFAFLPVESIIRARQPAYYKALATSDRHGQCDAFLEFALGALRDALAELMDQIRPEPMTTARRLEAAREIFRREWFSRKDYLRVHKALSTATASRDLKQGMADGHLVRRGERALAEYRFRS